MCLTTNKRPVFRIAKESFLVHKRCDTESKGGEHHIVGYYTNHHYCKKEKAPIRTNMIGDGREFFFRISSGLHFDVLYDQEEWDCGRAGTIWKVPKGAKYFISENSQEGVANRLEFVRYAERNPLRFTEDSISWAKPSLKRFIIKWKRYFKADY